MSTVLLIIAITLIGPIIGSYIGVSRKFSQNQVFGMLSFAAGIMVFVSVLELIPDSIARSSRLFSLFGITIGCTLMFILNQLLPHYHHADHLIKNKKEMRTTAIFVFLGLLIHNLPEGMAIGIGSLSDFRLSIMVALAIAIHDIPESVCVSAPYYFATKKKWKSFAVALSSSATTIVGFLLTYFLFRNLQPLTLGIITSATAGVMMYISVFELLPSAFDNGLARNKIIANFIAGALFVAVLHGLAA